MKKEKILILIFLGFAFSFSTVNAQINETLNETIINQTTCTVQNNYTTLPQGIFLNLSQNTSVSFNFNSLLFGECDLHIIYSLCAHCLYSRQDWTQEHGSNVEVSTLFKLPPLPTNQTNKSYTYLINFNTDKPVNQTFFNLSFFVPFEETNVTEEIIFYQNVTNISLTKQNITDFLYGLNRENLLFAAIVLQDIFHDLNFTFVRTIVQIEQRNVPVIQIVPINAQEYKKFLDDASHVRQFQDISSEKDQKFEQLSQVVVDRDKRLEEQQVEIDRLTGELEATNRNKAFLEASLSQDRDTWQNTALASVPIAIVMFGVWKLKKRGKIGKKTGFDAPKKLDPINLSQKKTDNPIMQLKNKITKPKKDEDNDVHDEVNIDG